MEGMENALSRRKESGLDIEVKVNGQPYELVPAADPAPALEAPEKMPLEGEQEDPDSLDESMISGMSDFEKSDMQNRKPKGLGDRARMDALKRQKKA